MTVDIPLAALGQVSGEELGWQVPGRREELVTELIRSLPKDLRRLFVPAPDTARAVAARLGEPHGNLLDALGAELGRLGGVQIPRDALDRVPAARPPADHVPGDGRRPRAGQREGPGRAAPAAAAPAADDAERGGRRPHPHRAAGLEHRHAAPGVHPRTRVTAYPALADTGDAVDVRLFDTEAEASAAMLRGTRRLLLLQVPSGVRSIADRLPTSGSWR